LLYVNTHIISVTVQIFLKVSVCILVQPTFYIFFFCFIQRIINLRPGHEISLQYFGFRFNRTTIPLLFHTVCATTDALIISKNEWALASVLTQVCVLHYQPLCHNCFHLAIIFINDPQNFTRMVEKGWQQLQTKRPWWVTIGEGSLVIKLYTITTYYVTDPLCYWLVRYK